MKSSLSIGIKDDVLLLKAEGEMRANDCYALKEFLFPYLENVDKKIFIILDLSKCIYMDSTFIGFIISLERNCRYYAPVGVNIYNPSEACIKALKVLACLNKINIDYQQELPDIKAFKLIPTNTKMNQKASLEMVFEAHQVLSDINAENRLEFEKLMGELKRVLNSIS